MWSSPRSLVRGTPVFSIFSNSPAALLHLGGAEGGLCTPLVGSGFFGASAAAEESGAIHEEVGDSPEVVSLPTESPVEICFSEAPRCSGAASWTGPSPLPPTSGRCGLLGVLLLSGPLEPALVLPAFPRVGGAFGPGPARMTWGAGAHCFGQSLARTASWTFFKICGIAPGRTVPTLGGPSPLFTLELFPRPLPGLRGDPAATPPSTCGLADFACDFCTPGEPGGGSACASCATGIPGGGGTPLLLLLSAPPERAPKPAAVTSSSTSARPLRKSPRLGRGQGLRVLDRAKLRKARFLEGPPPTVPRFAGESSVAVSLDADLAVSRGSRLGTKAAMCGVHFDAGNVSNFKEFLSSAV